MGSFSINFWNVHLVYTPGQVRRCLDFIRYSHPILD
jgi:hypothetical protein